MKIDGKHLWIFKVTEHITIQTNILGATFENEWAYLDLMGRLTIKATPDHAFAWDGATPKYSILDVVVGTPDGVMSTDTGKPKTYFGTLAHDVLYQFAPRNIITRTQADGVMLHQMKITKFKLRYVYYFFIRALGWIWWRKNRRY